MKHYQRDKLKSLMDNNINDHKIRKETKSFQSIIENKTPFPLDIPNKKPQK